MKPGTKKMYVFGVKPFFDKAGALVLILVCLPLLLGSGIILLFVNRGNVLFKQERVGKNQRKFLIFKFKTMMEGVGNEVGNHSKFGSFLRKLSLDELPQLFNVLKGEMSIVGSRPLLVEYEEYYNEREITRHSVLPGITGWAQVNGRNQSDWKTRLEHDLYYVDRISFFLDCRILGMTVLQLFRFKQADFTNQDQETFIDYAKKR